MLESVNHVSQTQTHVAFAPEEKGKNIYKQRMHSPDFHSLYMTATEVRLSNCVQLEAQTSTVTLGNYNPIYFKLKFHFCV